MFAKRHLFALVTALAPLTAIAQSPYAGQESRELKALSADEVASYVEGKGLGREATPEAVSAAVARSAEIHARIRASHLVTHIEQTRLLEPAQVDKYAALRGYTGGGATAPAHHKHH
jgi:hypothetical protein